MERLGTVVIVGVGLIGGSIGLALRARGLARRIIGVGRRAAALEQARTLGAIDEGTADLSSAVTDAEITVICTPVTRIAADAMAAAHHGPEDLLVTDVGSIKGAIQRRIREDGKTASRFVGAHPLAGSERTGVAHARPHLFAGRVCVLTDGADPGFHERAERFWSSLGARVVTMTPEAHDEAMALTSHLPHVVASALAGTVPSELLPLAAGSYRDGTRVAAADTELWTGILRANREGVLQAVDAFQERLDALRQALATDDTAALRESWNEARVRRAGWHHREDEC